MEEIETIEYALADKHLTHTAWFERDGGREVLTLDVLGEAQQVLVDTRYDRGSDIGHALVVARSVGTVASHVAYVLLYAFEKWGKSYGATVAFEVDDRTFVALYQEHPSDRNTSHPHPGVTLLEDPTRTVRLAEPDTASTSPAPLPSSPPG